MSAIMIWSSSTSSSQPRFNNCSLTSWSSRSVGEPQNPAKWKIKHYNKWSILRRRRVKHKLIHNQVAAQLRARGWLNVLLKNQRPCRSVRCSQSSRRGPILVIKKSARRRKSRTRQLELARWAARSRSARKNAPSRRSLRRWARGASCTMVFSFRIKIRASSSFNDGLSKTQHSRSRWARRVSTITFCNCASARSLASILQNTVVKKSENFAALSKKWSKSKSSKWVDLQQRRPLPAQHKNPKKQTKATARRASRKTRQVTKAKIMTTRMRMMKVLSEQTSATWSCSRTNIT